MFTWLLHHPKLKVCNKPRHFFYQKPFIKKLWKGIFSLLSVFFAFFDKSFSARRQNIFSKETCNAIWYFRDHKPKVLGSCYFRLKFSDHCLKPLHTKGKFQEIVWWHSIPQYFSACFANANAIYDKIYPHTGSKYLCAFLTGNPSH